MPFQLFLPTGIDDRESFPRLAHNKRLGLFRRNGTGGCVNEQSLLCRALVFAQVMSTLEAGAKKPASNDDCGAGNRKTALAIG